MLEAIAARGATLQRLSIDDAAAELLRQGAALWAVRGMRPVEEVGRQCMPPGATLLLEAPAEFVRAAAFDGARMSSGTRTARSKLDFFSQMPCSPNW